MIILPYGGVLVSAIYSIKDKEIQDAVIKDLKQYRALKVKLENLREREEAGIDNLFSPLIKSANFDELKAKQIHRALEHSLDSTERAIIEYRYLNSKDMSDLEIYLALGLKKGKYYIKKKEAVFQLAKALGII